LSGAIIILAVGATIAVVVGVVITHLRHVDACLMPEAIRVGAVDHPIPVIICVVRAVVFTGWMAAVIRCAIGVLAVYETVIIIV
jgi:hypothetical protein